MKPTPHLLALALAAVPPGAFAQSSVSNVTFTLTETHTAPALQEKDENGKPIKGGDLVYENEYSVETSSKYVETYEYGSKMAASKISNKEILQALADALVIPSITGWSIVLVNDDEDEPSFAANNGSQYIFLDDYMWIDSGEASAETSTYKSVYTETYKGEDIIDSYQETGSDKGKDLVSIGFEIDDASVYFSGIASWGGTLKTIGKGEDAYTQWLDGPTKISSISGSLQTNESDDASVIEGSISTGAAKLVDIY